LLKELAMLTVAHDLTWTKAHHPFGTNIRFIPNPRANYLNSFSARLSADNGDWPTVAGSAALSSTGCAAVAMPAIAMTVDAKNNLAATTTRVRRTSSESTIPLVGRDYNRRFHAVRAAVFIRGCQSDKL
jgi:hypothetical protein